MWLLRCLQHHQTQTAWFLSVDWVTGWTTRQVLHPKVKTSTHPKTISCSTEETFLFRSPEDPFEKSWPPAVLEVLEASSCCLARSRQLPLHPWPSRRRRSLRKRRKKRGRNLWPSSGRRLRRVRGDEVAMSEGRRSKNATNGAPGLTTRNKKLLETRSL